MDLTLAICYLLWIPTQKIHSVGGRDSQSIPHKWLLHLLPVCPLEAKPPYGPTNSKGLTLGTLPLIHSQLACACSSALIFTMGDVSISGRTAQLGRVSCWQCSPVGSVDKWGLLFLSTTLEIFITTTYHPLINYTPAMGSQLIIYVRPISI